MTTERRGGLNILGLGALACAACCAGPILAFLGGVSIAGLVSTTVIGAAGLVIAAVALVAYLAVRHRRAISCAVRSNDPVPVLAPTRRADAPKGRP